MTASTPYTGNPVPVVIDIAPAAEDTALVEVIVLVSILNPTYLSLLQFS
ncbi:hypothetical protein Mpsy_0672 [Methanolobus psychrophilus R15]|nr:hypothetical protein Mpsy_0672 [Methanolobus psychrophilus R15]